MTGTIKRHGHKRGAMTHGSKSHREHGSIGSSTTPSRVYPGLKMAGHMGAVRRTSKKQEVRELQLAIAGGLPEPLGLIFPDIHFPDPQD